jgi:cell division protein FtsZ
MLSGSDSNPACGREAALETKEELREALDGARYVIVLCGLGGATGTGAAPVVARIARDAGLMTAAICLWPFSGEGRNMESNAELGVRKLMKTVDIVVLVPNDALMEADPEVSLDMAFEAMDKIIIQAIKTIFEKFSSLDPSASP